MVLTFSYLLIKKAMGMVFDVRRDGSTLLDYDTPEGLGLTDEPFYFQSTDGYRLNGSRYYMKGLGKPKGLIVFFHGIGAGRSSYLHLMSRFVEEGYLVYAYDAQGSGKSEGTGIKGLSQPYREMKLFFEFLNKDEKAKGLTRYAIGHSWGGYAAMLSLDPAYKIEKAVSLSGFIDPLSIINALVKSKYLERIGFLTKKVLKKREGEGSNENALDVALKSGKPLLYIQGLDDKIVPYDVSGALVEKAAKDNEQIQTYFIDGRRHSCYLINEAEDEVDALFEVSADITKAGKIVTDLKKTGQEDPEVLKRIFDFLAA